jgi:hypothetical protein
MRLFKDHRHHLTALIMLREREPTKILADKGYIGKVDDTELTSVTPKKKSGGFPLDGMQARHNRDLSSALVIVENYFGKLQAKFHIMARRWSHDIDYYPTIFEICCALVSFDLMHGSALRVNAQDGTRYQKCLTHICEKGVCRIAEARTRTEEHNWKRRAGIAPTEADKQRQGVFPEDNETNHYASSTST